MSKKTTPNYNNLPVQALRGSSLRNFVRTAIHVHRLQDGDVILVKTGSKMATVDNVNNLSKTLGRLGFPHCLIATVDSFNDLTVLNEEAMAGLGWFRADAASGLVGVNTELVGSEVLEEMEDEEDV